MRTNRLDCLAHGTGWGKCACPWHVRTHAFLAAAAPHNPGFQTVSLPSFPGYALYPSAQVPQRGGTNHRHVLESIGKTESTP